MLLRLLIKCEISFFDFDGVVESDAGGVVAVLFVLTGRMAMAAVRCTKSVRLLPLLLALRLWFEIDGETGIDFVSGVVAAGSASSKAGGIINTGLGLKFSGIFCGGMEIYFINYKLSENMILTIFNI